MKATYKILFTTLRMTPPFFLGGAEVSQRILAERLCNAGYNVECLGSYAHPTRNTWERLPEFCETLAKLNIPLTFAGAGSEFSYIYKGIACTMVPQENVSEKLRERLEQGVNLVITGLEGSEMIIKIATEASISTVAWIHDVLPVGLSVLQSKPTFVLYTSKFVRQRAIELFGRDGLVFYPPFDIPNDHMHKRTARTAITLINPIPEKGINTFLAVSSILSQYTFFAVEGWRQVKIDEQYLNRNVHYIPRMHDLSAIYKKTRILLVPSHFEEGFGRVVTEAGLHGVPAITSRRGGLVEAVGEGAITLDSFEAQSWVETIRTIEKPANYSKACSLAREQALRFVSNPVNQLMEAGIIPS